MINLDGAVYEEEDQPFNQKGCFDHVQVQQCDFIDDYYL